MHSQAAECTTVLFLLVGTGVLFLSGCIDPVVVGRIPPSTFEFTQIVPRDAKAPSGWKVAQVTILLGRLSSRYPETAVCDVEVGVPEVTEEKSISTVGAQEAAAEAADEAARHVLKERLPTALACDKLRTLMMEFMLDPRRGNIPGARVRPFVTSGIPRRTFP
jgi:hypothetical protein